MKSLKLAALTFIVGAAISQTQADQTNLVQTLHVGLSAMKQGGTTTNRNVVLTSVDTDRLESRQITGALGSAIGITLSRSSKLVLVTPAEGGVPSVEVRDGDLKVDVSAFFVFEQIGASVTRGAQFLRTGDIVQTSHSIRRLALQDADGYPSLSLRFDVRGIAVDSENSRDENGRRFDFRAEVTGSGDSNGNPLIIHGAISVSEERIEVVSDDGGGVT